MDAQFGIIAMHLAAGLREKRTEVWQIKCVEICRKAITDSENVRFEIRIAARAPKMGQVFVSVRSSITDQFGGLFELTSTVVMRQPDTVCPSLKTS